jgi:hypothetical protein
MILKFKIVLTFQYISFLKSIWDRFQIKMYWNEKHFAYNVIIISITCYNYLSVYIVSSTYRYHFRNLSIVSKIYDWMSYAAEWSTFSTELNENDFFKWIAWERLFKWIEWERLFRLSWLRTTFSIVWSSFQSIARHTRVISLFWNVV